MATKRYNQESFYIEVSEGKTLSFYCWTTDTRNGFCHTVWCATTDQTTKVSYYNRTWESYTYQSALLSAFDKLPKADKEICRMWDEWRVKDVCERCNKTFEEFKSLYNKTPQGFKDSLAKSDIHLNSEEDVKTLTNIMALASLMQ